LDEIIAEDATLEMRRKNSDGTFTADPITLKIRRLGLPLYTKHPSADVAAMYVELPTDVAIDLLPTSFLADDDRISALEVHPGDELLCLGFPLAIDFNPIRVAGFLSADANAGGQEFLLQLPCLPGQQRRPCLLRLRKQGLCGRHPHRD
jgi:hypothetical protein